MNFIWNSLYNILIVHLGVFFYHVFSIFSQKMRKGIAGRRKTLGEIEKLRRKYPDQKLFLFHSASLGEYEQVKPVVKGIKEKANEVIAVVSFTSPSGYENADRIEAVDLYIYLPFDTYFTTRKFLQLLRPDKIIFVTYELWPNLLAVAKKLGISTYLISARIRSTSRKWKFYTKNYFASLYRSVDFIFSVTDDDKYELEKILKDDKKVIKTLGDPRYDQVIQRSEKRNTKNIPRFFDEGFIISAGSVWEQDLAVITRPMIELLKTNPQVKLIIAPHETDDGHVVPIINDFSSAGLPVSRYSEMSGQCETQVLVVDRIGILAELYHQSHLAFVGGSFKKAIHNVMEPAIAGIPVIFGPFYQNSREAQLLVKMEGGFSLTTGDAFLSKVKELMKNPENYQRIARASKNVILSNKGAGEKIVMEILKD
ncbi:MAG: hypothetical protein JXQ65_02360 [Candidatus Marinimicrobia bacterium]|nr:hypothetical protein [Candidatus Neomarinimicrobiota bacterium]